MVHNLRKAHKKWVQSSQVMGMDGVGSWTPGLFYYAVVREVLLYGSDMWDMSPYIGRILGRFHHRVVVRLIGWNPRRRTDGTLVFPPLSESVIEEMV